jgi:ankyrin repeat protein
MALLRRSTKAVAVVDRGELQRQEQEIGLFTRAVRQLLSLDAYPATHAYMAQSLDADSAAARTTAPLAGGLGASAAWVLHGALHARTILHAAAQNGRVEALEAILAAVADAAAEKRAAAKGNRRAPPPPPPGQGDALHVCLNTTDGHGDSALVLAARGGHLECCRLLLEAGCDPNMASHGSAHTALHAAALRDERETLEVGARKVGAYARKRGAA